jgi:Rod binding domain-containing protein
MSFSSPSLSSIAPALSSAGTAPINPALEPASVRNGPPAAKQAYQVALSFEQLLVSQLTQELAKSVTGSSDASSSDGSSSDASSSTASGLMGSDPTSSAYASMLPQALTTSIMSAGGLGIAQQVATAIDPALGASQASASLTGKPAAPATGVTA